MADYSGDYDPIGFSLTSAWIRRAVEDDWDSPWPPGIWGTHKDFRYGGSTEAKILGFLIDGHNSGMRRKWERDRSIEVYPPRILWDGRYKRWVQVGGYRFNNEDGIEWLIRNGYLHRFEPGGRLHVLKDF